MQNKQGIIQMYILIICLLMNGCCSNTSIGPFVKLPMEMMNPEKDSIQPISIFHEENNKIYSMDYSDSFQNIDCFDWDGYRKYIEAPVNRYEVNSIALVIDQDEAISNVLTIKKLLDKFEYVTGNRKLKYGILLQTENRSLFLKKTSRQELNIDLLNADVLKIGKNNIHSLASLESLHANRTDPCIINVSIDILNEAVFYDFLERISPQNTFFFLY